jgi:hypothetical protein
MKKLAWLALPLVLLSALLAASSAFALDDAGEPAAQLSEEGEWEEGCPEAEEEGGSNEEAEEECEAEAEGAGFSAAEDCYLRTARARVVAYPEHDTMRLTLGYTTYAPAQATVEYEAKPGHRLGAVSRSLGHSGVIRLSRHLGNSAMDSIQHSRHFTVTVHVTEAPQACDRFESQRLQVERSSDSQITWAEDR